MSVLPRPAEDFLDWAERGRDEGSILFFAICEADGMALGGVAVSAEPDFRAGLGYWCFPRGAAAVSPPGRFGCCPCG